MDTMCSFRPPVRFDLKNHMFIVLTATFVLLFLNDVSAQGFFYVRQFILNDTTNKMEVTHGEENELIFTLSNDRGSSEFKLYTQSYEIFRKLFIASLGEILVLPADTTASPGTDVEVVVSDCYTQFMIAQRIMPEETPPAGYLEINNEFPLQTCSPAKISCRKTVMIDSLYTISRENFDIATSLDSQWKKLKDSFPDLKIQDNKYLVKLKDDTDLIINKINTGISFKKGSVKDLSNDDKAVLRHRFTRKELKLSITKARETFSYLSFMNKKLDEMSGLATRVTDLKSGLSKSESSLLKEFNTSTSAINNQDSTLLKSLDSIDNNFYREYSFSRNGIEQAKRRIKNGNFSLKRIRENISSDPGRAVNNLRSIRQANFHIRKECNELIKTLNLAKDTMQFRIEKLKSTLETLNDALSTSIIKLDSIESLPAKKREKNYNNQVKKLENEIDSLSGKTVYWMKKTNKTKEMILFVDRLSVKADAVVLSIMAYSQNEKTVTKKLNQVNKLEESLSETIKSLESCQNEIHFELDSLKIEFSDDAIKNIIVEGMYGYEKVILNNQIPIQFSTIRHYQNLGNKELIDYNQRYKVPLSSIITYSPELYVNNESYCPADSVYKFYTNKDSDRIKVLYKEKASRLFELKAYTDFVGYTVDQPNGIVQFEAFKKIPLWVRRILSSKKSGFYVSVLNFYEPTVTIAKIEQNNKILVLDSINPQNGKGYISTLDLYRYANLRFDLARLNLLNMDISATKLAVELNAGCKLLSTPVRLNDSINRWSIISGFPYGEIRIRLKRDDRYGCSLTGAVGWLFPWDTKTQQYGDPTHITEPAKGEKMLLTIQFDAFYKPFKKRESSIFFRVSNTHNINPWNMNYLQIQLGYAVNILNPFKKASAK